MVYPLESNITWQRGLENMKTYNFGSGRIDHTFCPDCGTSIGGKSNDPSFFADNRALNVRRMPSLPFYHISADPRIQVRTLKGINLDSLKYRKVDGKNNSL